MVRVFFLSLPIFFGCFQKPLAAQISYPEHAFDYTRMHARAIEATVRSASNAIQAFGKQDSAVQVKMFQEVLQLILLQKQAVDTFPKAFQGNSSLHASAIEFFSKATDSLAPGLAWLRDHAMVYPPNIQTEADLSPEALTAYRNLNGINQLLARYYTTYQQQSAAFDKIHLEAYQNYACFALKRAMDVASTFRQNEGNLPEGPYVFDTKGFWDKHGPAGQKLTFTFGTGPVQGVGQIKPQFDQMVEGFKQCLPEAWKMNKVELFGGISWHIQTDANGWGSAPYAVLSLEQRGSGGEMVFWIQVFP